MDRQVVPVVPGESRVQFANGTVVEGFSGAGSATVLPPPVAGLRSAVLPGERDTHPEFEAAMGALGIREQETIVLDSDASQEIVLRPAGGDATDAATRVVL
jgi:hypothetical protein